MKTLRQLLPVLFILIFLFFQFTIISFGQQDCKTPMTLSECYVKVTRIVDGVSFDALMIAKKLGYEYKTK